jgi:asparagine synthase (glutamine-hydrolysing)
MSGIAGFFGQGNDETLPRMLLSLRHRGPDGEGMFSAFDERLQGLIRLGLVTARVFNDQCTQPFTDAATGITLCFSGVLYNRRELRERLTPLGHACSEESAEVVLKSFMEWGEDCFSLFSGAFSAAVYDGKKGLLWLARDRCGEQPLFYTESRDGFAFASEIGGLASWPGFDRALDLPNVQRFFAWGYLPAQRTVHPGCFSLPPGAWMRVDLATKKHTMRRYWTFRLEPDESLTDKHEPQLIEELRALLVQSVRRRLASDVPVGVFLSGGVDSGAALAAAARLVPPEEVRAFTIGFTEPSFDESRNAGLIADFVGVRHHVSMLTLDAMRDKAFTLLRSMSEPLGDASLVPTHMLAAFARQKIGVALSGDGGDELFAGYDPLLALRPARLYSRLAPRKIHAMIRRCVDRAKASDKNMSLDFKLKRVLRGLSYPESMRLPVWMGPLEPAEVRQYFADPLSAEELYEDAVSLWEENSRLSLIDRALLFFTRFYLPNDGLVKTDRAASLVSLEVRSIFLDSDIVAFCSRLPVRFKLRGTTRKYLLKKALAGWLPDAILKLPKKGFGMPLNRWLRELPAPPPQAQWDPGGYLERAWAEHRQKRGDHRLFLWSALALQNMSLSG